MSNIVVMSKSYSDERAIADVINYVLTGMEDGSTKYTSSMNCVCYGVNPLNLQTMINSFMMDKRIYGKEDGKQIHHFILSMVYKIKKIGLLYWLMMWHII